MNKCVWNTGGMILTCDSRSSGRATCRSATWSTTDAGWTDLGSKSYLRGERLANFVFSITICKKNSDTVLSNASGSSHFYLFNPYLQLPISFAETLN